MWPHISAPSRHGCSPAVSTRDCTNTLAIGSRASTASTTGRSRSSTTRTGAVLNTLLSLPASAPAPSADGDDRLAGLIVGGHLFGETQCLLDEGLHDLRLRHGLDHLAL